MFPKRLTWRTCLDPWPEPTCQPGGQASPSSKEQSSPTESRRQGGKKGTSAEDRLLGKRDPEGLNSTPHDLLPSQGRDRKKGQGLSSQVFHSSIRWKFLLQESRQEKQNKRERKWFFYDSKDNVFSIHQAEASRLWPTKTECRVWSPHGGVAHG